MEKLSLAETIAALRAELAQAAHDGTDAAIRFPVEQVQIELSVTVAKEANATAGVKFWVVNVGGGGKYTNSEIQKITVTLGTPVDREGRSVSVHDESAERP